MNGPAARRRTLFGLLALGVCAASTSVAQPPAPPDATASTAPLHFRRVYAPAERVEDWPRGLTRYVPVEPAEFERLVRALDDSPEQLQGSAGASVERGRHWARWSVGGNVEGRTLLDIVRRADGPIAMPLEPCGLAIRSARWTTTPDESAAVGLRPDSRLAVLVPASGELELRWSLAAQPTNDGGYSFALDPPAAPVNQLELTLPTGWLPEIDEGLVTEAESNDAGEATWRIELGAARHAVVRVSPPGADERRTALPARLRETLAYSIAPDGLELTSQWRVDADAPLDRLTLRLDEGLRILSAKAGEHDARWTAPDGDRRVVLTFPEPIRGTDRAIRILAAADVPLHEPWSLPRITTDDLFWQEGAATLVVDGALSLDDLRLDAARQTRYTAAGAAGSVQVDVQRFGPQATMSALLRPVAGHCTVALDHACFLDDAGARATVDVALNVDRGRMFAFDAAIGPLWEIDSVESLDDGEVAWNASKAGQGRLRLSIRTRQAIESGNSLRLRVRARRATPEAGARYAAEDLVPLSFENATKGRLVVAVQTAAHLELAYSGAVGVPRLRSEDLSPAALGALDPSSQATIHDLTNVESDWRVACRARSPRREVRVEVDVTLSLATLQESCRIACPAGDGIPGPLLVHFHIARNAPLVWRANGESGRVVSARRLRDDEMRQRGLSETGEYWEVAADWTDGEPVDVSARRTLPWKSGDAVALVSVVDGEHRSAMLRIHAGGHVPLTWQAHGLVPATVENAQDAKTIGPRAVFDYEPLALDASLIVHRAAAPTAGAAVLSLDLASQVDAAGSRRHALALRVRGSGRPSVVVTLPPAALVQSVLVDGDRRAAPEVGQECEVALPTDRTQAEILIEFSEAQAPLRAFMRLEPPRIAMDVPVLASQWRLSLPPDFETLDAAGSATGAAMNWRQRLFGPLGRPSSDPIAPSVASLRDASALSADGRKVPRESGQQEDVWLQVAGRPTYVFDSLGKTPRVWIVRAGSLTGCGLAIGVAIFAGLLWRRPQRIRTWTLAAVAAAIVGLLTPAPLAGLTIGWFSAVCLAMAVTVLQTLLSGTSNTESAAPMAPSGRSFSATRAIALLIGVGLFSATSVAAQSDEAAAVAETVYRVFIPVGEDRQPTGASYQVPEEFHQQLRDRASRLADEPHGWLLLDAKYAASLAQIDADLDASAIVRAAYEIQVFARATRVEIPLGLEPGAEAPAVAMVDGRSVPVFWDAARRSVAFSVDDPGVHGVEFAVETPVLRADGESRFTLRIPALATSKLALETPADSGEPQVSGRLGGTEWSTDRRRVSVDLGAIGALDVAWSDAKQGASEPPDIEVEELLWLKVQPGAVVLDARLKLAIGSGAVRYLNVRLDPRLRPLPSDPLGGANGPRLRTTNGNRPRIDLGRSVSDAITAPLSLLLSGSSGVGRFLPPALEIEGVRVSRRWLAVTVDPSLEFSFDANDELPQVPQDRFLREWGATGQSPAMVRELAPAAPASLPSLACWPRHPLKNVEATAVWTIGANAAQIVYDAQVFTIAEQGAAASSYTLSHRIRLPAALEIDEVSVRQNDVETSARWSRDAEGNLLVFLSAPVTGEQLLHVVGSMPIDSGRPWTLPKIGVDGARDAEVLVDVRRRPTALVSIAASPGVEPDQAIASPAPGAERVASFHAPGAFGDWSVDVSATENDRSVSAVQAMEIRPVDRGWQARLTFQGVVERGRVDELRFRTPNSWIGPFTVEPAANVELLNLPGEQARELVIRPRSSWSGPLAIEVVGALQAGAAGVEAPHVVALDASDVASYFVLPKQKDGRPIEWNTSGVRPDRLPPALLDENRVAAAVTAYRLVSDSPRAIELPAAVDSDPRVELAEFEARWSTSGAVGTIARFSLVADDRQELTLAAPHDHALVHATVNHAPLTPRELEPGRWAIATAGRRGPLIVEAMFAGQGVAPTLAGRVTLTAPRLEGLSVRATQWSVAGPIAAGPGHMLEGQGRAAASPRDGVFLGHGGIPPAQADADGELPSVAVEYAGAVSPWPARLAGAAVVVLAGLAIGIAARAGLLTLVLLRAPFACAALLGLAWWLWLVPSEIGLLILLASVVLAVAPRGVRRQRHYSSVMPFRRPV